MKLSSHWLVFLSKQGTASTVLIVYLLRGSWELCGALVSNALLPTFLFKLAFARYVLFSVSY
jgi:hypothetical protein